MLTEADKQKIKAAGEMALTNRYKGFHCSESVFLAVNETFGIVDPSMVRMVTGFHGGGGTHATEPGVDITALLEEVASGRDTRPGDELPITQVGHLCGALASSLICIGLLYGRKEATDDLNCVDELCFELHRRFQERLGEKECVKLFPKWKVVSPTHNCEHVYKTAAELAVELILEAPRFLPACRGARKP
jgi:C_GCAxxG_C_C family probable redox protein